MRKLLEDIGAKVLNEYRVENSDLQYEIYKMVSKYVTHGEWRTPNQFDHVFFRLMGLIPRPKYGMSLFRVIRLNDEQLSQYKVGELILRNRKFSSWTRSLDIAMRLAQTKGDNCIIVSEHFGPEHIVIDVPAFYEENEMANYDYSEWEKYVRRELEVIVYDNSERVIDGFNSYLFQNKHPDTVPIVGDAVFLHDDDDDGSTIHFVDDEQDFAQRGLFLVTLQTGSSYYVRSIGPHQWEVVTNIEEDAEGDPERAAAFNALARGQRGDPEIAMLRVQNANTGGVLSYVVEHVGDLTHRMAQYPNNPDYFCGYELVEPKVRRSLRMLESRYGFAREAHENDIANARYHGISLEDFQARLNRALSNYAFEHEKLKVYNEAQYAAREAAVSLGKRDWDRAARFLHVLQRHLTDRETWSAFASPYDENYTPD